MSIEKIEKFKHQNANFKWFDRLAVLSKVEGQIPITKIKNSRIRRKILITCSVCLGNWFFGFGYYLEFGY
jgi:hypothetical protein